MLYIDLDTYSKKNNAQYTNSKSLKELVARKTTFQQFRSGTNQGLCMKKYYPRSPTLVV